MRAEFLRAAPGDGDEAGEVVAAAVWSGTGVEFDAPSASGEEVLARIFRPTPVAVDDPSLRSFGTFGTVELHPGTVRWFLAAARDRASEEGLQVRFSHAGRGRLGWDPAGAYRTFAASAERIGASEAGPAASEEPGGSRPEGERPGPVSPSA